MIDLIWKCFIFIILHLTINTQKKSPHWNFTNRLSIWPVWNMAGGWEGRIYETWVCLELTLFPCIQRQVVSQHHLHMEHYICVCIWSLWYYRSTLYSIDNVKWYSQSWCKLFVLSITVVSYSLGFQCLMEAIWYHIMLTLEQCYAVWYCIASMLYKVCTNVILNDIWYTLIQFSSAWYNGINVVRIHQTMICTMCFVHR